MDMRDNTPSGILKLWTWLRGLSSFTDDGRENPRPRSPVWKDAAIGFRVDPRALTANNTVQNAVVLQFPIRGEALLVKLAELLRGRLGERKTQHDPLLLSVSRAPGSRLSIDQSAYVEFYSNCSTYHVVVEAEPNTTVTLDTTDFDTLVQFVVQYVNGRLSEPATLEAAS
jgi:hypothetical protein